MIHFANPRLEYTFLKKKIDKRIKKVLDSNTYILGNEVNKFEKSFSKYIGTKYSVGVSSGTDALILALKSIGIKKGDEIITTSHTAFATIAAIVASEATPVFADIKENDFTIDTSKLLNLITKKTKAIIAVHIYGNPVEIKTLVKIAKQKKIKLIEDCAQAHGAEYQRKKVGSFGLISCFSFYPTKNLSTFGDGGAVSTSNKKIYKKIKLLREYGWKKKNYSIIQSTNKRLDEIHAAILNIKIQFIDKFNSRRINIAKKYLNNIKSKNIILPKLSPSTKHVFHLFVIRIKNNLRKKFLLYLKKNKIVAGIHYPMPNHMQKPYKKYKRKELPITNRISKEIVSLPIYPMLKQNELKKIINVINNFK